MEKQNMTQQELEKLADEYATSIYGYSNERHSEYLTCKNHCIEFYNKLFSDKENIEEEEIPVTIASIKNTCGWGIFCDITGMNPYALKEFDIKNDKVFYIKLSHAKELGLYK